MGYILPASLGQNLIRPCFPSSNIHLIRELSLYPLFIHSSSVNASLVRVVLELEFVPGTLDIKQDGQLDIKPVHRRVQCTNNHLHQGANPPDMLLGGNCRTPRNPTCTWQGQANLHTERNTNSPYLLRHCHFIFCTRHTVDSGVALDWSEWKLAETLVLCVYFWRSQEFKSGLILDFRLSSKRVCGDTMPMAASRFKTDQIK